MEFRVRSWPILTGVLVAVLFSLSMVLLYQEPSKKEQAAPVQLTVERRDEVVETTQTFRPAFPAFPSTAQTLNIENSCGKDSKNCKTLVVRDSAQELMTVDPRGNVTVAGDLTVKGKINGAAPACPVYIPPPPVICKVEPAPRAKAGWWDVEPAGFIVGIAFGLGGVVVLGIGLKVFDKLS